MSGKLPTVIFDLLNKVETKMKDAVLEDTFELASEGDEIALITALSKCMLFAKTNNLLDQSYAVRTAMGVCIAHLGVARALADEKRLKGPIMPQPRRL